MHVLGDSRLGIPNGNIRGVDPMTAEGGVMTQGDRKRLVVILAIFSLTGVSVFMFPDRVARLFADKANPPTVRRQVDVSAER
jgi:hypothetical protein